MAQNPDKKDVSTPKSLKDAPMPPLPFAHQIKQAETGKKDELSLVEMLKKIDDMYKLHDKIAANVDEILQKTGWTPKYLESYLSNPNNFNSVQWEALNKERKSLMDSIKTPADLKKDEEERKKRPQTQMNTPDDPSLAKERRKKSMGARRNWMPIR